MPDSTTLAGPEESDSGSAPSKPPKPAVKPKPASNSSLFNSVGKDAVTQGQAGLGPEGSSPQMIAMQGWALVSRGLQMMSLAFPGIVPVLADLLGRLQQIIPQMVSDTSNGGSGMFPPTGITPQQPPMQGAPSPMGPPQAGPPMPSPGLPPQ